MHPVDEWADRPVRAPTARGAEKGISRIAAGDLTQDIEADGKHELNSSRAFNAMMADLRSERASRQQAEEEVARGAVSLKAHSVELEGRTRTIDLLGRMAHRLPGSKDEQEFVKVIERFVPQTVPRARGARFMFSATRRRFCDESASGTNRSAAPRNSPRLNAGGSGAGTRTPLPMRPATSCVRTSMPNS
jgi:hypothetical protein